MRTQILQRVGQLFNGIKAGNLIPGSTERYTNTVKTVSRAMLDPTRDMLPALIYSYDSATLRQFLSDVRLDTMNLHLALMVFVNTAMGQRLAADVTDSIMDDITLTLTLDPQLNQLARRTRVTEAGVSPEAEEYEALGTCQANVDYVERNAEGMIPTLLPAPLAVDPADPRLKQIMATFFNSMLTLPNLVWVERAPVWPMPGDQIPSYRTPGIWIKEQMEEFEYVGSPATKKTIDCQFTLFALEFYEPNFASSIDCWTATIMQWLGSAAVADLGHSILSLDLRQINSLRSEFPLIQIECSTNIRYVQSYAEA
jgi:hypothetical protein